MCKKDKNGWPDNHLAAAEMSEEQNYNQIDGILNNEPPKASVLDILRQGQEDTSPKSGDMPQWER